MCFRSVVGRSATSPTTLRALLEEKSENSDDLETRIRQIFESGPGVQDRRSVETALDDALRDIPDDWSLKTFHPNEDGVNESEAFASVVEETLADRASR